MINEILLQIHKNHLSRSPIHISFTCNKVDLEINITYQGSLIKLPYISPDVLYNLFEDDAVSVGILRLFKGAYPDKIKVSRTDNTCKVNFLCYLQ